jgi:hypothetical protein
VILLAYKLATWIGHMEYAVLFEARAVALALHRLE